MGRSFFRNYCSLWYRSCSQSNEFMMLYKYQRSRSFIDLRPRPLRFINFKLLSLETPKPIKAKLRSLHENLWQSSSLESKRSMTLKLEMQHWLHRYYKICSNDDPGLTLTYFTTRSNLVPLYVFYGKCLSCGFPRNYWSLWGEYRCTHSQTNEYMTIYGNLRSKSFIDLCPTSLRFNIFKRLYQKKKKTLGHLKANFIWSLHGMLGWKYIQMFWVTWPRWRPGPYMVKTLKNHLLRNQEVDDLETWYTALL